jgi:hypothetical protein
MGPSGGDKLALLDWVSDGKVRVNVEATGPLDRAQDAFKPFADGTQSKLLVTGSRRYAGLCQRAWCHGGR